MVRFSCRGNNVETNLGSIEGLAENVAAVAGTGRGGVGDEYPAIYLILLVQLTLMPPKCPALVIMHRSAKYFMIVMKWITKNGLRTRVAVMQPGW